MKYCAAGPGGGISKCAYGLGSKLDHGHDPGGSPRHRCSVRLAGRDGNCNPPVSAPQEWIDAVAFSASHGAGSAPYRRAPAPPPPDRGPEHWNSGETTQSESAEGPLRAWQQRCPPRQDTRRNSPGRSWTWMGSASWMGVSPMGLSSSSLMEVCPSNSLCWFLPMYRAYVHHAGVNPRTRMSYGLWSAAVPVCGESGSLQAPQPGQ